MDDAHTLIHATLGSRRARRPVPLPELREALAAARIRTRYQPIVPLRDAAPLTLEVLARLQHPARGMVGPTLFVPQIETAGLAWPLTEAVVRRAFADWGGGRLAQFGLTLALNFPLDVLLMPAALNWLDREREAAGISPSRITVELTESRPVGQLANLRPAVERLRRAGYGIAIDDVGPGLRDADELSTLAFSVLKLDKGVVQASRDDASARAFVERTIRAAHGAGLRVVAEGVADLALWRHMSALGADEAQGFLVARPMQAAAVPGWLEHWHARGRPA